MSAGERSAAGPVEAITPRETVDRLLAAAGSARQGVRELALTMRIDAREFRVMHPLDVLESRLNNLHSLAEKQNDMGRAQLVVAIAAARAYQVELAGQARSASDAQRALGRSVQWIEHMALSDAGRKVAIRHQIHVADAAAAELVEAEAFWKGKWPQLVALTSSERAAEVVASRAGATPGGAGPRSLTRLPASAEAEWRCEKCGRPGRFFDRARPFGLSDHIRQS